MSNVLIRNVPPEDLDKLRAAAAASGESLQSHSVAAVRSQAAYLRRRSALKVIQARLQGRAAVPEKERTLEAVGIPQALEDAAALGIEITAIPWTDLHRAWDRAQQSLRYADALYVAAAERLKASLMTADTRVGRSGATLRCPIITISPEIPSPGERRDEE